MANEQKQPDKNVSIGWRAFEGRFLTKRDLAEYLQCSKRTVERMVGRGTLPKPVYYMGRPRWPGREVVESLRRLMEGR